MLMLRISYAQSATATLTGTVEDQNGVPTAGANIALIKAERGSERLATTNREGTFVFALLPPGKYSVIATAAGFAPVEIKDVVLNVNDQVGIRIRLTVGPISQTIQVVDRNLRYQSPAIATVVANANYFVVNGVSENIATITFSTTWAGTLPGVSINGTTNPRVLGKAMALLVSKSMARRKIRKMEVEKRIAKIECVSVRLFGLAMLLLALLAAFLYSIFELIKFISHLWPSW